MDGGKNRKRSHPARVRGLKLWALRLGKKVIASHPARVRGLKPTPVTVEDPVAAVAPCAGAWIETGQEAHAGVTFASHPARVRGLKQKNGEKHADKKRRTLRGCVD